MWFPSILPTAHTLCNPVQSEVHLATKRAVRLMWPLPMIYTNLAHRSKIILHPPHILPICLPRQRNQRNKLQITSTNTANKSRKCDFYQNFQRTPTGQPPLPSSCPGGIYIFNLCFLNETPASLLPAVSKTTVLDHLPYHLQGKGINKNLCISSVQCDQWHKRCWVNEQKQQTRAPGKETNLLLITQAPSLE